MVIINIRRYRFRTILLFFVLSTVLVSALVFFKEFKDYQAEKNVIEAEQRQIYLDRLSSTEISGDCSEVQEVEYYTYSGNDPLWNENNKFGIYIYAEVDEFFDRAEELVNSGKGDWGYVLIPYNVKDKSFEKWNNVFKKLNDKHLIPVFQLHDVDPDDYKDQTEEAAAFLNRFIWPIRYRYISAYNEPNDRKFWYGKIDPEEYAKILDYTIGVFKEENPDFFMMNGAFNVTAPSDYNHMDSLEYMRRMEVAEPGIFKKLDGWASHSYPQPNFSGDPYNEGRWSIKAYETELSYLKKVLKIGKDLPVFLTETGWAHAEGADYNSSYLPVDTVSEYFEKAYEDVWLKDKRIRAVMPFTIKYDPPFDHFSWLNADNVPYKHFDVIRDMKKETGKPPVLVVNKIKVGGCAQ